MKTQLYIICFISSICFSQNKQILYGFNEIPQSILLNPAEQLNNDWYVGVPLLSQVHIQTGWSGFSAYDLFKDDGVDFSTKLSDVLYQMNERDFFVLNQQLDLFSAGFAFGDYEKNKYLSFGMYQEMDAIAYFPKDLAILAYEGNANNTNRNYKLSHLNASVDILSVFHVGFSKKVNKKLSYGVRGKIYSGIVNVNSVNNRGSFVTNLWSNNIYNHVFNLDLELRTSGISSLISNDDLEASDVTSTLKKRMFFGGNLGLGVDLGVTYNFKKQWQFAASLNDLGFIRNAKDVENYAVNGNYNLEGLEVLFPNNQTTETTQDNWDEIKNTFKEVFKVDTLQNSYTSWRPIKFNSALSYNFKASTSEACNCSDNQEYTNKVGVQLFAVKRPKHMQAALTAFYQKQLFKSLGIKVAYTIDDFSYNNLGAGLSANIFGFNMYFMADNLLQLKNIAKLQSTSVQFGFNYAFKKKDKT